MAFCSECGKEIAVAAKYCNSCGQAISKLPSTADATAITSAPAPNPVLSVQSEPMAVAPVESSAELKDKCCAFQDGKGEQVSPDEPMKSCPICGTQNRVANVICRLCGMDMTEATVTGTSEKKLAPLVRATCSEGRHYACGAKDCECECHTTSPSLRTKLNSDMQAAPAATAFGAFPQSPERLHQFLHKRRGEAWWNEVEPKTKKLIAMAFVAIILLFGSFVIIVGSSIGSVDPSSKASGPLRPSEESSDIHSSDTPNSKQTSPSQSWGSPSGFWHEDNGFSNSKPFSSQYFSMMHTVLVKLQSAGLECREGEEALACNKGEMWIRLSTKDVQVISLSEGDRDAFEGLCGDILLGINHPEWRSEIHSGVELLSDSGDHPHDIRHSGDWELHLWHLNAAEAKLWAENFHFGTPPETVWLLSVTRTEP